MADLKLEIKKIIKRGNETEKILNKKLEEIRKGRHGSMEEQMAYKKKIRKIHFEQNKLAREMGYPRGLKQFIEENK